MMSRLSTFSVSLCAAIATVGLATSARADTAQARCDVYPIGEDTATSYGPCTFSQRQGFVTLTLEDGTTYELVPDPNQANTYTDQYGQRAIREDGLGEIGTIYRLADVSIFVYWDGGETSANTAAINEPQRGGGWVPCSIVAPTYDSQCETDVIFGDPGNSSLTLYGVTGTEHHLAFYGGALHAIDPGDNLQTQYLDGQYFININDEEFFRLDEIVVTGID
ncbi:MAG: hypothetical protein ACFBSG_14120 [Leptolyngbyaceae cyanobacterium]